MEIKSKRHPYKFYLKLVLINALFLFLIFYVLDFFEQSNKSIIGSLILLIITISINVGFFKNSPTIFLSKLGITINNNFYNWNHLLNIKLTGKGDMIFTSMECATLTFNDNISIRIYDDFYINIAVIKSFIQQIVIDKKDKFDFSGQDMNTKDFEKEIFAVYKGYPLLTFLGIYLTVILLLLLALFFNSILNSNSDGALVSVILIFTIFFVFYRLMNYFEVSKNIFCVRKHYFFWKKKCYKIANIEEVVIEKQGKFSSRLRLITTDFNSKLYPGVSLYNKTWLRLKKDLESKNIIVRNENIYENN